MSKFQTILVTGATGQQGGATAMQLLARDFKVRAMVRDRNKESARALEKAGAELIDGDLEDATSLRRALKGVHGAFLVTAVSPELTKEKEIAQGLRFISEASHAGIKHLVFTSSAGSTQDCGVHFLESKYVIEDAIYESQVPFTILKPTAFMENFKNMWLRDDQLYFPIRADLRLPMIATRDIGAIAAIAFQQPDEFIGETRVLVADVQTPVEIAETFSKTLGRQIVYKQQPIEEVMAFSKGIASMYKLINEGGLGASSTSDITIKTLKKLNPEMWNLRDWVSHTYAATKVGAK